MIDTKLMAELTRHAQRSRRQAHPGRRRPAACEHRPRRDVRRAEGPLRRRRTHRGDPPAQGRGTPRGHDDGRGKFRGRPGDLSGQRRDPLDPDTRPGARRSGRSSGRRTAPPRPANRVSYSPTRMPTWRSSMPISARCAGCAANLARITSCQPPTGKQLFAAGDRLQFTGTDKKRGLYNGAAGTVTGSREPGSRCSSTVDGREPQLRCHRFSELPPRLCRHDLQRAGTHARPNLPLPLRALALGCELCRADPAPGQSGAVRSNQHRARRDAARTADGAGG